jgi:hypothetical protein
MPRFRAATLPQPVDATTTSYLWCPEFIEVLVSNVKKSGRMCVHFPANMPLRAFIAVQHSRLSGGGRL